LYVTDGGHYENLGLVELLRRKCRYIWCVDASGESQDGFSTIAGAVALAYNELGLRIDIDPAGAMAPNPTVTATRAKRGQRPVVRSTFCTGTVHYSDDEGDIGRLVVIKTGVPVDAPENVTSFYEANAKFPCDPTLDQLYTADRFDAYRALGAFSFRQAWADRQVEFDEYRGSVRYPDGPTKTMAQVLAPRAGPPTSGGSGAVGPKVAAGAPTDGAPTDGAPTGDGTTGGSPAATPTGSGA
jgi:hypothetical protein